MAVEGASSSDATAESPEGVLQHGLTVVGGHLGWLQALVARHGLPTLLTRRRLQVALGLLWILDGALQFQPYMYQRGSNGFMGPVTQNTMGAPNLITDLIRVFVTFGVGHQILFNVGIGLVQLAIGAGLLWRPTVKAALATSVAWGIGVWVIGEALGQMIFPQASMLTGAPGAALIYSAVSLALWPKRPDRGTTVAEAGLLGDLGTRLVWAVMWCGTALLELQAGNYAPNAISAQLTNGADGQPAALGGIDHFFAHLFTGRGTAVAGGLLVAQFVVGWTIVPLGPRRGVLWFAIILSLFYWVVGQDLGSLLTGQATDPNLGPPMVLFALSLWPRALGAKPTTEEPETGSAVVDAHYQDTERIRAATGGRKLSAGQQVEDKGDVPVRQSTLCSGRPYSSPELEPGPEARLYGPVSGGVRRPGGRLGSS